MCGLWTLRKVYRVVRDQCGSGRDTHRPQSRKLCLRYWVSSGLSQALGSEFYGWRDRPPVGLMGFFFSTQHYKVNHCQVTLCTYGVITGVTDWTFGTVGRVVAVSCSSPSLSHCLLRVFQLLLSRLVFSFAWFFLLAWRQHWSVLRPWIGFMHHANVVEYDHPGQELHLFLVFCSPVPKSRSRCRTSHAMLSTHIQLQRNLLHVRGPQGSGSSGTTRRDCICQ